MKEKFKITGKGELHNMNYGTIKINDNKNIIYNKELNQYRDGIQWLIPFHKTK